jgi:hypothetical protein
MNEAEFRLFLKRGGRTPGMAERVIRTVRAYADYLAEKGQALETASITDLDAYVDWLESDPKASAKGQLHAIRYYYQFSGQKDLEKHAHQLRQARIKRKPFALREFRSAPADEVEALAAIGITDVSQMLAAGKTPVSRQALAEKAGLSPDRVLEFVKLSDLARLPGLKSIRARLYYDAGVDTVEVLATWEPEALRQMLADYITRSGFDGIAPLPREAENAVATARRLPSIVEY